MSKIVAGRFGDRSGAEAALGALPGAGFQPTDFQSFFVTPPGQHAIFPVGGDSYSDEGAKDAGRGAVRGVIAGGGIGLVAGIAVFFVLHNAIIILAGIGIGAYVGSLLGALSKTRSGNRRLATTEHPVERPAGYMVAIRADRPESETQAIELLRSYGARDIERTEGQWQAGDWKDFDPRMPSPLDRGVPTRSVISGVTSEPDK